MRTDVLGVGFDNLTMGEALDLAEGYFAGREAAYVVTPNPEIVQICRKDGAVKEAVANAALVLPDGIGVVYGARILKRPLKERVPGADFAEKTDGADGKNGEKRLYIRGQARRRRACGEKSGGKISGTCNCGYGPRLFQRTTARLSTP